MDLGGPQQRAVIARLVCARGYVVSTDQFIDDLWQGQPPPKATATLQVYISNLRRVLEPGRTPRTPATLLISAPPGYRLHLDADAVDAWHFPKLIAAAAASLNSGEPARALETIDEALALWTGPAYAEFADEEWAVPEVVQLEELRMVAVEYRAEAGLTLGRHTETIPELERHVTGHPLRENAVRLLALAYYRAGRQGEALAVLRRTRDTLADELGVDPGPDLRKLEADILVHADFLHRAPLTPPPDRPQAAPSPPPSSPAPPPTSAMIGRTAELARLKTAAAQATRGFRVAWLGGDAGSGKSTLAEALARALSAEGWQTVVGRCPETQGGVPPAWAWSEVLRQLTADRPPDPEIAVRLAPLLTDDAAQVGQFWLAQAVGDYLESVPGPLLIVLEDTHRADEETLQLLRHLASRMAVTPVLVLLTHRPSEADGDLLATGAALAVQAAENVTLPGLGEEEVGRLLLERSGTAVDAATVRTVTERTGGNPLFVSEIARLLAAEGPSAAHGLPPGVRGVIRRRIARLPATAQTTLRNAAILGRDADADVLIAMSDADEDIVLDGLEIGVLSGLLTEPLPGHVRFAHVLVRETLYEDVPRLRRTRLHGRVVEALERIRPADVGALGHHALASATSVTARRAAEYAGRAAAQASSLYAHREATALLTGALEALDLSTDPADEPRLDLLCRLVSAHAHSGDVMSALRMRHKALAIARRLGDPLAVARAVTSFDAPTIWTIQPDTKVDHDIVQAIRNSLPADAGELRCRLLVALSHEIYDNDLDLVEAVSSEALEIARRLGDPQLVCMALNARFWVLNLPGRGEELEQLGDEMLELSAESGLLGYQTFGHYALVMVNLGRCEWDKARWHADRAVEYSTGGQLALILTILNFLDAVHHLLMGEFDHAEAVYTAMAERMGEAGGANAIVFGALGRFAARFACGRDAESVADLADARARIPQVLDEAFAHSLIAAGRLDEARAAWPSRHPYEGAYQQVFTVLRAENAIALDAAEAAEECYRLLLPWAGELAGLHSASITLCPIAHTLGQLAGYLGDPPAAAGHYATALEVATRIGSPHWAERARQALAPKTTR
ncbi:BTAD domain-containing putative transcriptional regulator [Nonomuraea sp. NPDC049480]|uniref:BTAD domain-containing putative transcriptional regulator n=1 Tax=Nonomuraea sp. NPDC049480 TaxID=3364353 RepID=UPI00379209AF